MSNDIVERLDLAAANQTDCWSIYDDAADEIKRLRAELTEVKTTSLARYESLHAADKRLAEAEALMRKARDSWLDPAVRAEIDAFLNRASPEQESSHE